MKSLGKQVDGDQWILDVRKLITDARPNITVGRIMSCFNASSPEMDLLSAAYADGKTPEQAYARLKKKFNDL